MAYYMHIAAGDSGDLACVLVALSCGAKTGS